MYIKADIERIEKTFSSNRRVQDRFDPIEADKALKALRRRLNMQKRTAEAARNIADMMMAWMNSFQKQSIAKA